MFYFILPDFILFLRFNVLLFFLVPLFSFFNVLVGYYSHYIPVFLSFFLLLCFLLIFFILPFFHAFSA